MNKISSLIVFGWFIAALIACGGGSDGGNVISEESRGPQASSATYLVEVFSPSLEDDSQSFLVASDPDDSKAGVPASRDPVVAAKQANVFLGKPQKSLSGQYFSAVVVDDAGLVTEKLALSDFVALDGMYQITLPRSQSLNVVLVVSLDSQPEIALGEQIPRRYLVMPAIHDELKLSLWSTAFYHALIQDFSVVGGGVRLSDLDRYEILQSFRHMNMPFLSLIQSYATVAQAVETVLKKISGGLIFPIQIASKSSSVEIGDEELLGAIDVFNIVAPSYSFFEEVKVAYVKFLTLDGSSPPTFYEYSLSTGEETPIGIFNFYIYRWDDVRRGWYSTLNFSNPNKLGSSLSFESKSDDGILIHPTLLMQIKKVDLSGMDIASFLLSYYFFSSGSVAVNPNYTGFKGIFPDGSYLYVLDQEKDFQIISMYAGPDKPSSVSSSVESVDQIKSLNEIVQTEGQLETNKLIRFSYYLNDYDFVYLAFYPNGLLQVYQDKEGMQPISALSGDWELKDKEGLRYVAFDIQQDAANINRQLSNTSQLGALIELDGAVYYGTELSRRAGEYRVSLIDPQTFELIRDSLDLDMFLPRD